MATIKAYTDIEQSKKLAEILPIKSADMYYTRDETTYAKTLTEYEITYANVLYGSCDIRYFNICEHTPCWSLAALSEFILPYIADDDGNNYKFYLSKDGLDRWIAYYKSDDVSIHICEESDNMIDVILEMVCWLKKEEYI